MNSSLIILQVALLVSADGDVANVPWIQRPIIGVQIDAGNPLPEPKKGFWVTGVLPGCRGNLQVDDLVLSIDGKEVNGKQAARKVLLSLKSGSSVELHVQREFLTAANRPQKKRFKTTVDVRQYGEWAFSQMHRTDDEVREGAAQFELGEKLVTYEKWGEYVEPFFSLRESGEVQLYWRFCYQAKDWLFIRQIEFRIKDRVVTIPINAGDIKRHVTNSGIREEISYQFPMTDLALLNALGAVSEIPVSYGGENFKKQFKLEGHKLQAVWDGTAAAIWKSGNPD